MLVDYWGMPEYSWLYSIISSALHAWYFCLYSVKKLKTKMIEVDDNNNDFTIETHIVAVMFHLLQKKYEIV